MVNMPQNIGNAGVMAKVLKIVDIVMGDSVITLAQSAKSRYFFGSVKYTTEIKIIPAKQGKEHAEAYSAGKCRCEKYGCYRQNFCQNL